VRPPTARVEAGALAWPGSMPNSLPSARGGCTIRGQRRQRRQRRQRIGHPWRSIIPNQ